jgi:small subunit ribosomal protein S1
MARSASQKRAHGSVLNTAANAPTGAFASMLEETFGKSGSLEGKVVQGKIISIENDFVLIDVGLKSEGRIPLREFALAGQPPELKAGDTVEVFLERMENRDGEAMLSREKAKREESWTVLQARKHSCRVHKLTFVLSATSRR